MSLQPNATVCLERVRARIPQTKREIWPDQAIALFDCVCDRQPKQILEIGTALGYSAAVMAEAAPLSEIWTLNPKPSEFPAAQVNLRFWWWVHVLPLSSEVAIEYPMLKWHTFDFIFVDGSHTEEGIAHDLQWFSRLPVGGFILFHDYSPEGSARPLPAVYDAVNRLAAHLKREPDYLVTDRVTKVGMAGFIRRRREQWPTTLR